MNDFKFQLNMLEKLALVWFAASWFFPSFSEMSWLQIMLFAPIGLVAGSILGHLLARYFCFYLPIKRAGGPPRKGEYWYLKNSRLTPTPHWIVTRTDDEKHLVWVRVRGDEEEVPPGGQPWGIFCSIFARVHMPEGDTSYDPVKVAL